MATNLEEDPDIISLRRQVAIAELEVQLAEARTRILQTQQKAGEARYAIMMTRRAMMEGRIVPLEEKPQS